MEYKFTDDNFKSDVLEDKGVVMVDFYADWCGPCKMMAPHVEALANDPAYESRIKIGKLNVDDSPNTAASYGVMSIPTVIFFKNGEKIDQFVGSLPKSEIKKHIDAALAD